MKLCNALVMRNGEVYFMSSEQELNASILKMNMFIQKYYPELMKYMGEMPITIPNEEQPAINQQILNVYYSSLFVLVLDYATTHNVLDTSGLKA